MHIFVRLLLWHCSFGIEEDEISDFDMQDVSTVLICFFMTNVHPVYRLTELRIDLASDATQRVLSPRVTDLSVYL